MNGTDHILEKIEDAVLNASLSPHHRNLSRFEREHSGELGDIISRIRSFPENGGENIIMVGASSIEDRNSTALVVCRSLVSSGYSVYSARDYNAERGGLSVDNLLENSVILLDLTRSKEPDGFPNPVNEILTRGSGNPWKGFPVLVLRSSTSSGDGNLKIPKKRVANPTASRLRTGAILFLSAYAMFSLLTLLSAIENGMMLFGTYYFITGVTHTLLRGINGFGLIIPGLSDIIHGASLFTLFGLAAVVLSLLSYSVVGKKKYRIMIVGLILIVLDIALSPLVNLIIVHFVNASSISLIADFVSLSANMLYSFSLMFLILPFVGRGLKITTVSIVLASIALHGIVVALSYLRVGLNIISVGSLTPQVFFIYMVPLLALQVLIVTALAEFIYIAVRSHYSQNSIS